LTRKQATAFVLAIYSRGVIAAGMLATGSTSQAAAASIAALGMLQTTLVASS
jgi:hypothetical protein